MASAEQGEASAGRSVWMDKPYSREEIESILDPLVREWFFSRFKDFSPPQRFAIMEIHRQNNVLVSSPTGSGKTLAAFLAIINELVILARNNMLEDKIYCIYISPLRALSNDIERNLQVPLAEIYELAKKKGIKLQRIRVAKRTGDTTASQKSSQLKKPPHILITTPESFTIALSSPKFSQLMAQARYVVVDEIHSIAENKRGSLLSLALERLEAKAQNSFVRIGLSATIHPLEEVAKFLVGFEEEGLPRHCKIVDVSFEKRIDVEVLSPVEDLIYTPTEVMHEKLYQLLDKLIEKHTTTLIFTNTRSGTERVRHHLKTKFKDKYAELVEAHHGSLSREIRLDVERKLKEGKLKCVVSSTSLELGIDIGYIDLVVLIGSPKSVTRAIQRIGRSGHRLEDVAKGKIVVLDRDDLVEWVVMAKNIRERKLDKIHIPTNTLDVLCQQLVGMSIERGWKVEEAFSMIKRSYTFHNLSWEDYMAVLRYLNGEYVQLEERNVYAKLWFDEETMEFGRRGKMIRPIYYLNVGTIPEESYAKIYSADKKSFIGMVEEEFMEKLTKGDRFVLGGKVYEFLYSRGNKGYVKLVEDAKPTVPSWFSEQLPLTYELAQDIGRFRFELRSLLESGADKPYIIRHLMEKYKVNRVTAEAIYNYFREQYDYLFVPTHAEVLVENYMDELGRQNIIFHTLVGRRANEALSRAYAYALSRYKRCNVRIMLNDNGFALILPRDVRVDPHLVVELVTSDNLEEMLRHALEGTEILKRRFRHVATRSFLILRRYGKREKSVARQQVNAEMLLKLIKRIDPNFPLLKETYREIMEDAMDIKNAKLFLKDIEAGRKRFVIKDSVELPSPFALNLVVLGSTDAVLMEDRRELIKLFHHQLMKRLGGEVS